MSIAATAVSAESLTRAPILRNAAPHSVARLLMRAERRTIEAGNNLFTIGQPATEVFLIEKGEFAVLREGASPVSCTTGYLGEEAVVGSNLYKETVVATDTSTVFVLPTAQLRGMADDDPKLKSEFFHSFMSRHDDSEDDADASRPSPTIAATEERPPVKAIIGWLITIALPFVIYHYGAGMKLPEAMIYFLAIVAVAVSMWVFELMPEFVPPLVSVVAVILLDIASPQVALSGFVSDTFFMCLSVFAVGALMVSSGLTYRLSLRLLSFMPSNRFGYNLSLFISGVLLAPVIPSPNGRMTMIAPFCVDLVDGSKPRPRDPGASEFLSTAVNGIALPAAIFLTGKPANLIVLGMFDYQTQYIFQWLSWLQAAAVVGVILLVAHFVVSAVVFRGSHKFGIPRGVLQEQVKALGPLSGVERGALIAVVVLAVGIVTTSLHKIDIPWVALATLTVLLMFGLVGRLDLRTRVDWPLLIFIGTIVAWVPVMQKTGLDKLIIKNLGWLGAYMKTDLQLFIGILCVLVVLVRFALPGGATTIIFATAMFPLATAAGVSPWLVGFVILVMSESHILPYQQPYDLQTRSLLVSNKMEHVIDDNRTVLFHVLMTFVRIGAIYASMPYWRYLGIV